MNKLANKNWVRIEADASRTRAAQGCGLRLGGWMALAFLASMTLSQTGAEGSITNNGVVWTRSYEGDVLPDVATPSWDHNLATGTSSTDGDILTISTLNAGDNEAYQIYNELTKWDSTTSPSTLEFRTKVNSLVENSAGGVLVRTGTRGEIMRFRPTEVELLLSGVSHVMDTTGFHTYRITVDNGASPVLNVYLDQSPTPILSGNGGVETATGLDFGEFNGGWAGSMDWDYIRWTNSEATPVPEPSSTALIAGALALLVRCFARHRG